jgi:hypothetical protein
VDLTDRHPATVAVAKHFAFDHLPEHLQAVSREFHDLVVKLLATLPDSTELTVSLRKLLEAKDSAVRAAVDHHAGS